MEILFYTLSGLAWSIPIIIIWLISIALALSRWQRHPRVSLFTLMACALMIVTRVVSTFLYVWLPTMIMKDQGSQIDRIGFINAAIGGVSISINVVAWALILCAIFGWRDLRQKGNIFPPAPPTYDNEPHEQNVSPEFSQ